MSVGPIPWTAIDAWAVRHQLDQEVALLLIDVIRIVDNDRAERRQKAENADRARGKGKS